MSTSKRNGKCSPYLSDMTTFSYKQVTSTAPFKSSKRKRTFEIFHHVNCNYRYVIYLHEYDIIQHAGKSETPFNIRLNNHRKDVEDASAIPTDTHFTLPENDFSNSAKFPLKKFLDKILKGA